MLKLPTEIVADSIALRRKIHQNPELGFQEYATADLIAEALTGFGFDVHRGLAGTGVVGTLTKGTGKRRIGLRADIDALPMQDQSGAEWASKVDGKAHTCGHDGHTASLLAAARYLADQPFEGTLRLIFQPAEENEGGAREMIADGLFEKFPVDAVYGMHNWPALPVGTLVARDCEMMAAFGTFQITITGKGAHGAMPHEGTDTLLAASQLVSALQSVVSRNVSALKAGVVSVTQIHGGDAWNVLPETAVLRGTTRWFAPEIGDVIETRMAALVEAVVAGFGCKADFLYERRYPSTLNTAENARFVRELGAQKGLEVVETEPSMAAEDFAFMLEHVPGCYFWMGSGKPGQENPGLHNPRFDFNDDLLETAAAFWAELVLAELSEA